MITNNLNGKIVVITGGCGNIGYGASKALASMGARIISIVRKDITSAQEMMQKLPNNHLNHFAVLASISDSDSLKNAVSQLDIAKCDILINNAGKSFQKSVYKELTDDIVNDIIDTNIKGLFYTVREFLELLYKSNDPLIINISSASAKKPDRANLLYAASKAAIDNMTRCMALNMAPKVRVVGIAPGYLETPVSGSSFRTNEEKSIVSASLPLKRIVELDEVIETIVTISTGFKFMTGTTIPVDCGATSSL